MARKKDTPQKAALREMMGTYLKENNVTVKDGTYANSIMRDMMSIILKVPWIRKWMRNWDIPSMIIGTRKQIIPEMAIPRRPCIPATAIWRLISQETRKGEFEPQIVKKYQNTVTHDMEEKIISMYAKGMTTNDIESHMRELL